MSNVYFPSDCREIIKRMPRNELSRICQKTVREWGGEVANSEVITKKLTEAHATLTELQKEIVSLESKQKGIFEQEAKKRAEQELLKEKDKINQEEEDRAYYQRIIAKYAESAMSLGIPSEMLAVEASKEYLASSKDKRKGWKAYLIEKKYLKKEGNKHE